MPERAFLIFRLSGPMAAFGRIAVGERRDVWGEPSKSGVLGFVAGALGLRRDDAEAQAELAAGLGFAVRVDAPGRPLRDYHTAQAPKARRGGVWTTRREELGPGENLNTVLSERIYRIEACATVALWRTGEAGPGLEALAAAIRRPAFAPFLGRKSCPMGEAAWPEVVEATGLAAAFEAYDAQRPKVEGAQPPGPATEVWFELGAGLAEEDAAARHIRERRDAPGDRLRRRFGNRSEGRLDLAPDPLPDPLADIVT
ncbi:type I-E CRISPR-associated protein Cas5/CasD [Phenylobacterium sp.]|uniref:type I-E CRISPR-associated protein Cas5/CasD n=1 Tax=Phenylobacterium sp. TaxID=1871053 RepID=UPI00301C432D